MAPFRFALQVSNAASPDAWRALARKTEDLGYSTLYMPDHLGDQWAPLIALTVAAEATTTLRVGTLVLDNDFRHPVILAMEAATMDVVTGGRFEFGMGAGWMTTDYNQSGIPMDPAPVRIARLAESLEIMTSMWSTGRATLAGEFYNVNEAVGTPNPVTPGGPPLVIGGGSKRILTLAGQYARGSEHRAQLEGRLHRGRGGGRVGGGEVHRSHPVGPRCGGRPGRRIGVPMLDGCGTGGAQRS